MAWEAANILEGVFSRISNLINFLIADRQKVLFWLKLNVTVRPTAAYKVNCYTFPKGTFKIVFSSKALDFTITIFTSPAKSRVGGLF